jgi:hypothetical protein
MYPREVLSGIAEAPPYAFRRPGQSHEIILTFLLNPSNCLGRASPQPDSGQGEEQRRKLVKVASGIRIEFRTDPLKVTKKVHEPGSPVLFTFPKAPIAAP